MTADSGIRMNISGRLAGLEEAVFDLLSAVDSKPELVRGLDNRELLTLLAWTQHDPDAAAGKDLRKECERRLYEHEDQARRLAVFARPGVRGDC